MEKNTLLKILSLSDRLDHVLNFNQLTKKTISKVNALPKQTALEINENLLKQQEQLIEHLEIVQNSINALTPQQVKKMDKIVKLFEYNTTILATIKKDDNPFNWIKK